MISSGATQRPDLDEHPRIHGPVQIADKMTQQLDLTLLEDRVIFHGPEGAVEFPLAYQVHSRLIQTGELARLLAEHLREETGAGLPEAGGLVRLALPLHWGLVCIRLPHAGLGGLAQPLHQVAWEIDANAPESVEQYFFDFQDVQGPEGKPETHVLAVRQSLIHFCGTFLNELGLVLSEIVPASEDGAGFRLDVARARGHREELAQELYRPATPWRKILVAGALALLLVAGGSWLALRDPAPVTNKVSPPIRPATAESTRVATTPPAPADSVASPTPVVLPKGAESAALGAWKGFLDELAVNEDGLPDWLVLDAEGLLLRTEGRNAGQRRDWLARPASIRAEGRTSTWLALDKPLAGGRLGEDPGRPVLRLQLAHLSELSPRLREAPARLMLQRRRVEGTSSTPRWHFGGQDSRGASAGWQITVFQGPVPQAASPH